MTNVGHDREGERDTNDGKEDTEETAWKGDRGYVAITNSCEDCSGEEDRLDEVPANSEVLIHNTDTSSHSL